MAVVFMFAGQGSQYYGMGRQLYEENRVFREWMDYCSDLAAADLGISLTELLYKPRANRFEPFDQTLWTHPAVFIVNFSVAQTLMSENIKPDVLLGYSLGEMVALTLAGAVRLEQAIHAVISFARLIEERTRPAGMLAVLGPAALYSERGDLFSRTELACDNYSANFVVTGLMDDLELVRRGLEKEDVSAQILPITRGFHSAFIDPAEAEARAIIRSIPLGWLSTRVVSSVRARELADGDLDDSFCWDVIRRPVEFARTIEHLERTGPHIYIDAGPSGSLAAFIKYGLGKGAASKSYVVLNQFGHDISGLARLKTALES